MSVLDGNYQQISSQCDMMIPSSGQEAIPYINTDINTGLSTCIVTTYMYSYVIRILCV